MALMAEWQLEWQWRIRIFHVSNVILSFLPRLWSSYGIFLTATATRQWNGGNQASGDSDLVAARH